MAALGDGATRGGETALDFVQGIGAAPMAAGPTWQPPVRPERR